MGPCRSAHQPTRGSLVYRLKTRPTERARGAVPTSRDIPNRERGDLPVLAGNRQLTGAGVIYYYSGFIAPFLGRATGAGAGSTGRVST